MRITNKYNLPDYVVRWAMTDHYDYEPDTLTATQLVKPMRQLILLQRHDHEIEADVSDFLKMRMGTAIHDSFERIDLPDCEQEQRVRTEIKGHTITGKFDILKHKKNKRYRVKDIKHTSVTKFLKNNTEDYIMQLSILRFLLWFNGYAPLVDKEGDICFFFSDWMPAKAQRSDYPSIPVLEKAYTLYNLKDSRNFIERKVSEYRECQTLPDKMLPPCAPEDLWYTPAQFAVMKKGRKSAIRLHESRKSAERQIQEVGDDKMYMEERPARVKRCAYCFAKEFCDQYKRMQEDESIIVE